MVNTKHGGVASYRLSYSFHYNQVEESAVNLRSVSCVVIFIRLLRVTKPTHNVGGNRVIFTA